jgi:hypothetical protein
MPPSSTIPSRGAISSPAFTASPLVTVKIDAGSRFMLRSSCGEAVVECAFDKKSVDVSILPNMIPADLTVDLILVICSAALQGFLS